MPLLSYLEWEAKRAQERTAAHQAAKRINSDIKELAALQHEYLTKWTLQLEAFEKAINNEGPENDSSQIYEAVDNVEKLLTKIDQLERTEQVLKFTIIIERTKKEVMESSKCHDYRKATSCLSKLFHLDLDASFTNLNKYLLDCQTWAIITIEENLKVEMGESLTKLGWPKQVESSFWKSPELEVLIKIFDDYIIFSSACGDDNVYERPVKVMMEPIRIRFNFHFDTNRQTNRLDKPEWFLSHILQLVEFHYKFLQTCLEIKMEANEQDGNANANANPNPNPNDNADPNANDNDNYGDSDSDQGTSKIKFTLVETFVTSLVEIVKEHLSNRIGLICKDSFLLLHTVSKVICFTNTILEKTGVDCYHIMNMFFEENLVSWISAEREAANSSLLTLIEESQPWREQLLKDSKSISTMISGFITLLDDLIKTLHNIPPDSAKVEFLNNVIIPMFNTIYEKIDFEVPAFHATKDDIYVLILQANSIALFVDSIEKGWGESIEAIHLGQTEEFKGKFGYDATELPGTIFNKVLLAFRGVLERVEDHLFTYLWQNFSQPALSFVRAMHYGIARESKKQLTMHDELRKALVSTCETVNYLRKFLYPSGMSLTIDRFLHTLGHFLFDSLILENFFRPENIPELSKDLNQIRDTFRLVFPDHPVDLFLQKVNDALKILEMPEASQVYLKEMIMIGNLDEITNIFQSIHLSTLTITDCEKILNLIRS